MGEGLGGWTNLQSKGYCVANNRLVLHFLTENSQSGIGREVAVRRRPLADKTRFNNAGGGAAIEVDGVVIVAALLSADPNAIST